LHLLPLITNVLEGDGYSVDIVPNLCKTSNNK
jgi:hypothetical protein